MAAAKVALIDTGSSGSLPVPSLTDPALIIIHVHICMKNDHCTDSGLGESMISSGSMLAIRLPTHVVHSVNKTSL